MKIAIIDDRQDQRHMIATAVSNALSNLDENEEWEVLESFPLDDVETYTDWISQENVGILLVDERLSEQLGLNGETADYTGGDVVTSLRRELKSMPIYGVTSFPENVGEQQFGLFDDVINRTEFTSQAEKFVRRFIRQYEDFLNSNETELTELSELSEKIALGNADQEDVNRAKAIQQAIQIPVTSVAIAGRDAWLKKYEETIDELKKVQQEASEYLAQKPPEEKK